MSDENIADLFVEPDGWGHLTLWRRVEVGQPQPVLGDDAMRVLAGTLAQVAAVEELCHDLERGWKAPLYPTPAQIAALFRQALTSSPAECQHCGGPMPGRKPGDVCRDCQGSAPVAAQRPS